MCPSSLEQIPNCLADSEVPICSKCMCALQYVYYETYLQKDKCICTIDGRKYLNKYRLPKQLVSYLDLGALQGRGLLHDNDVVWVENQWQSPPTINTAAKCQMQNVSNGDGFLALSMLRKVLEGKKALFAQEQYKVLLGAEAALINYALFWCNVNDVRRDEMLSF